MKTIDGDALVVFDRASVRIERACARFCKVLAEELTAAGKAAFGDEFDSASPETFVRREFEQFMSGSLGLGTDRGEIFLALRRKP